MSSNKTIYALSTLMGKSGVALFRISGDDVLRLTYLLTNGIINEPEERKAIYSSLRCPITGDIIDKVLITYFRGPNSFTGEDTLEICTHGSIAVIKKLLQVFGDIDFLRSAEPGEFSKRSFLNGKMDLTQAEGLSNLIEAETQMQQAAAMRQMEGGLSSIYNIWRSELISILASVEALIDFPTEDLPQNELEASKNKILDLRNKISQHLNTYNTNVVISNGFQVSIVGSPNAGKSSLLNYLAKSDVAIVSDISGTTRDVVSIKMDLDGYATTISDTAGLRDNTDDIIEQEGIKRSYNAIKSSNLILFVVDTQDYDESKQSQLLSDVQEINENVMVILNKVDSQSAEIDLQTKVERIAISLKTEYNCEQLIEKVKQFIEKNYAFGVEPIISSARVYEHLKDGVSSLDDVNFDYPLEIVSEYLRAATSSISKAVGDITIEDILDQVFGAFCIGK